MIRTKSTLIIGPGAGLEIEMPDRSDLLNKIAQGFDFKRLGSELQTRDMVMLARHFEEFSRQIGTTPGRLREASETIRVSALIGSTIDAVLEQHSNDPAALAAAKLAIVYYTLQSEARSPLALEPKVEGDLPLRGSENWLFQLGRLITSGVPRHRVEHCFDDLSIISFSYDRSIQHYLPFVVAMAFGMTLNEARQLVAAKLNITHPFGNAGRLPWEQGDAPDADWGNEEPSNIHDLVKEIQTASERGGNPQYEASLHSALAESRKIVFLGYDFDPQTIGFLFGQSLSHDPEAIAAVQGMNMPTQATVLRTLKRCTGIEDEAQISILDTRCFQMMRDYALFLES